MNLLSQRRIRISCISWVENQVWWFGLSPLMWCILRLLCIDEPTLAAENVSPSTFNEKNGSKGILPICLSWYCRSATNLWKHRCLSISCPHLGVAYRCCLGRTRVPGSQSYDSGDLPPSEYLAAHIACVVAFLVLRCPCGRFCIRSVALHAVFILWQSKPDSFVYAAEV